MATSGGQTLIGTTSDYTVGDYSLNVNTSDNTLSNSYSLSSALNMK